MPCLRRCGAGGVKLGGTNRKSLEIRTEAQAKAGQLRPLFTELAHVLPRRSAIVLQPASQYPACSTQRPFTPAGFFHLSFCQSRKCQIFAPAQKHRIIVSALKTTSVDITLPIRSESLDFPFSQKN
jgi:hypothetical protein